MFCAFTRPRYQVSVYRTIGPLVSVWDRKLFVLCLVHWGSTNDFLSLQIFSGVF